MFDLRQNNVSIRPIYLILWKILLKKLKKLLVIFRFWLAKKVKKKTKKNII
jgi:hypothetical protein